MTYEYLPTDEGWENVQKLIPILKVFKSAADIISGSEYRTSNLFLSYVSAIKKLLDKKPKDF